MNLTNLFELQKELDYRILKQHNLEGKPLLQKKILALQVELSELANETRCFKYWSQRKPSSADVILEEYVDSLHFILSLGIEKNYVDVDLDIKYIDSPLTDQFLNLYIDVHDFAITSSRDQYITLFEDFLNLGTSLGFSYKQVESAYLRKNSINHERQSSGY